ncbi:MAG TPA: dTMP kinase [Anaerolineaceae bacterium]|jgi:dTMP kinase|nr:dTMP kinase [Anaerolineaceae bacterium]HNW14435.1 dTMP kinase [Anaerolineaceae bacterium]HOE01617.1 dTMP kinase [Anaerolineaceae bacterium]HQM53886.1 dTMP kinase [Anaerolineaceae bacterium]HRT91016.1 dTMP kinase [Anaerolineaceae bacterium]
MFITLEGPDGSGKSIQVPALAEFVRQLGYDVLTTREPGGTSIGDQIREVIMSMKNKSMNPRTEILLFCAARAQIVSEVIRPQLEKGVVVISDRYADSTLAYQGYGHGLDLKVLRGILDFATGGLTPDLTLLLDVDVETGLSRRQQGGGEWNRLDDYALAFHRRVRDGYLELAAAEPQRWVRIDASQAPQIVQQHMQEAVLRRLRPKV